MQGLGYQDQTTTKKPVDRALELCPDAKGPKGDDNYYTCRCPAHNDKNPSLLFKAIGDEHSEDGEGVFFKCFAGCSREAILSAINLDEKDLHYHSGSAKRTSTSTSRKPTLTAFDLAVDKCIHPNELASTWGVEDGQETYHTRKGKPCEPYDIKGVTIPYFTEDGKPYERRRLRVSLTGDPKIIWNEGTKPTIPYASNRLEEARKAREITLTEGESDVWTLYHHGFPALGVPGASNYACIKLAHLKGIDRVYIIQEPDEAGQAFPSNVKKHLDKIGYTGKVYVVDLAEFEAKDPNELHKKDVNGFKATFEKALLRARPLFIPGKEPEKPCIFTLQELMKKEIPPARWVIPDILPEGLFLLTGKPKIGKSWLGLDMALGIAWGGAVMGKIRVEQGEVLYLALEDNERRLQKRLGILLSPMEGRLPEGFYLSLTWPRVDQGGAEALEDWIKEHPKVRLIIVDTWTKLSPRLASKQQSLYETQYDALVPLKALSDKYSISIVAVHHNRKMAADDPLDEISGTTGLSGSVDGCLILRRERGQTDAVLHIIGRDIEDDQPLAVNFNKDEARWKLEGKAEDFAKTKERQAILDVLKLYPDGLTARAIADKLDNKNVYTVRNLLSKLQEEGKVQLTRYTYTLIRSEHSEGSEDSYRSEHSEVSDSPPNHDDNEASEPHYGNVKPHYDSTEPHYGGGDAATHAKGPVKPVRNRRNPNLTMLTTVATEPHANVAYGKNGTHEYEPSKPQPLHYCAVCEDKGIVGSTWRGDRLAHDWICSNFAEHIVRRGPTNG